MAFNYADASFSTPLLRSIVNNDRKGVREALKKGFSANLPDNRGWTPLHEAAINNDRSECLKELLSHSSADINGQTHNHQTPLFLACKHKCFKAVKILLDNRKCNINITDTEGVSPLHVACSEKDIKIIKALVQYGANVNLSDFNDYTPLHEVVSSGKGSTDRLDELSHEICSYLLSNGASSEAVDCEGNLPLHLACQNGLLKCVNLLCSSSSSTIQMSVNLTNSHNRTPLMLAVQSKNLLLVEMMLSFGANANVKDEFGTIALHLAAHTADFKIFNLVKKATNNQTIIETCTFNEDENILLANRKIHSLICYAIDTEVLEFVTRVLETDLDQAALHCPIYHKISWLSTGLTMQSPVCFLLEGKMHDLGDETLDFLQVLIDHGSPVSVTSNNSTISYMDPICAALSQLDGKNVALVMNCLRLLLLNGADPDTPYGGMPHSMQQACMMGCPDAAILLLQYSNVLEPDDVLKWILEETDFSSKSKKVFKVLLHYTPNYFKPARYHQDCACCLKNPLTRLQFPSLTSYCRAVIRKELHEKSKHCPKMFKQKLLELPIPKALHNYLSYM